MTLANQTDGVPFVTNDLPRAVQRLADDLSGYYLLGYYTTNTKWDGGLRTIKVKRKSSGDTIRARPATKTIVVELPLAPFTRGSYSVELTAGGAGKTEQRKLTFTMK